jgi:hypothetical protein
MSLSDFKYNVYSQNGEDGIIEEIFNRLPKDKLDHWCVEFGAWDGVHLSNTCNLVRHSNYKAVLIEADKKRYKQLLSNFPSDNVIKLNKWVNFEGEDSLDNTLSKTPLPKDFDFLSIDIDGVDYWVWESLRNFRPKVVCIEFNPTIPNMIEFTNPRDFKIKQGSSAKAIVELATEKGYKIVSITNTNLFFVENNLIQYIMDSEVSLEELNPAGNDPNIVFSGYDGTLFSTHKKIRLGWHFGLDHNEYQILPTYLRQYSGDYSRFKRFLFLLYILLRYPKKLMSYVKKRLQTRKH